MFWIFLLGLVVIVALVKLGMLSIWIGIYKFALQLAAFLVMAFSGVLLWRWLMRRRRGP